MVALTHLISHRFRGFAPYENTIQGLETALDFGVVNLEFDIRVARCGTPMIYHDEDALCANGESHCLADIMAKDYVSLGGTFAHMPTAEALFSTAAAHNNTQARLLIDIKDAGFEHEIHALVNLYRLQDRVIYVSWIPEVLFAMHDIAPNVPLCLSHWCQNPNAAIRHTHKVFEARDGHITRSNRHYIHGERSGWFVNGPLRGNLHDILVKTGGAVCVPQNMITKELVERYHRDGIEVSTFSYVDWPHIQRHEDAFNIDLYFVDNKIVFDNL